MNKLERFGFSKRASFVGPRRPSYPGDPNMPYTMFLRPLDIDDPELNHFEMQCEPIDDGNQTTFERRPVRVTFRKRDGVQIVLSRKGKSIPGFWRLDRVAP